MTVCTDRLGHRLRAGRRVRTAQTRSSTTRSGSARIASRWCSRTARGSSYQGTSIGALDRADVVPGRLTRASCAGCAARGRRSGSAVRGRCRRGRPDAQGSIRLGGRNGRGDRRTRDGRGPVGVRVPRRRRPRCTWEKYTTCRSGVDQSGGTVAPIVRDAASGTIPVRAVRRRRRTPRRLYKRVCAGAAGSTLAWVPDFVDVDALLGVGSPVGDGAAAGADDGHEP